MDGMKFDAHIPTAIVKLQVCDLQRFVQIKHKQDINKPHASYFYNNLLV